MICSEARRAQPESKLEQRHMDLAASIQAVTEEIVLRIGRELHRANAVDGTWCWPAALR